MSDKYCVAIFGGAVAGSEAVAQMVKNGVQVVVFEQNSLPYGKIETGLPKWHVKPREKQEQKINERLNQPNVHYVPLCQLGKDIDFADIINNWGFSAILLATGAWKDRPFPIIKIEQFIGNGFCYQNPFVQWFNLFHDPNYAGPKYKIYDNAVIIGGGLASIDVAKILMIETTSSKLKKLGHDVDAITIERLGLKKSAEMKGVSIDELELKKCRILYRKRIEDMPLSPDPVSNDATELKKVEAVRQKIIKLAQEKYLFEVVECQSPRDIIIEDGKLAGLLVQKNKVVNSKAIPINGELTKLKTPLVISSIGSIPEFIPGISLDGEKIDIENHSTGKLKGFKNVFALGNAITGKGNIRDSQKHGRNVSESIIRDYLGVLESDEYKSDYEFKTPVSNQLKPVASYIEQSEPLKEETLNRIISLVKMLQKKAGYKGYHKWIKENLPIRLEIVSTNYAKE